MRSAAYCSPMLNSTKLKSTSISVNATDITSLFSFLFTFAMRVIKCFPISVFQNLDHEYSQPTAEVIQETFTYTSSYGPLDITTYFIYAGAVIAVTYVRETLGIQNASC